MVMLIVQHNYGQGYESTIMVFETASSTGAGIMMLQEFLLILGRLVIMPLIYTGPKLRGKR